MKIKLNFYDYLPLLRTLEINEIIIVIRFAFSYGKKF